MSESVCLQPSVIKKVAANKYSDKVKHFSACTKVLKHF